MHKLSTPGLLITSTQPRHTLPNQNRPDQPEEPGQIQLFQVLVLTKKRVGIRDSIEADQTSQRGLKTLPYKGTCLRPNQKEAYQL